ncbi:MAG TPA: MFS transporter, partial [Bacilli bacterium]|nr:MFS transporter [Bacilli bacterium]
FLFSFIGGTFADRWRPKRTMVYSDLLSALSVFAVLATLASGVWQAIFFATLISSILSQFSQPSAMKLFKQHVPEEQLQMGMSMFQSMMALFMVIGPSLGTWIYSTFGIEVSIGVMGIAFLLSAGVLTFLPADKMPEADPEPTTIGEEMKAGFRYVFSRKVLRTLAGCFAVAGFALGVIQPLAVFIITEKLGLPKENLQWFLMANGVAMLIGGGLAMGVAKKLSPDKMLAIGMVAAAISLSIVGVSTNFTLSLAAQFFSGLFLPMIHIGINTILLQSTEEKFIGRANGILNPLFMGMMVVTMSVSGPLKELTSLTLMYQVAAGLFLVGLLVIIPLFKHGFKPGGGTDAKGNDSSAGKPEPVV